MGVNKHQSRRRGQFTLAAIATVGLVCVLGVVGLVVRGGLNSNGSSSGGSSSDAFEVRRGDFNVTIPVSGELAALNQIEIRNDVDGRAIITEIVAEGTFVHAGDVVLRLNDDEIRNNLQDAQDQVNTATAALTTARAELIIQQETRTAELAKAELAIMLADLALKSWQEGESVSKRQEFSLKVETSQKEYDRLAARFEESTKLLEKKFIALDEWKKDEIAMIQAKADLETAKLDVIVYEKYQSEQDKAQKESDLAQANSERSRVQQQYDAEVESAQSEVVSKTFQLELAQDKLREAEEQLGFCTIRAPSSGLVVYYSSLQTNGWGRNEGRPPQVGTELTRNEPVMILPDTSQMIAAVKVSEALSGQIQPGQRAIVTSDAVPDRVLRGEVVSVGVLAEGGGWRDPNRRDYTVKLRLLEGSDLGLKPAMRCKAEINVGSVRNAVFVPIQSVFRAGPQTFVYMPKGSGYAQSKVAIGRASELYIEITEGLNEGDVVLLREPEADEVVSRLVIPKDESNPGEEAFAGDVAPVNGGPGATQGPSAARGENQPAGFEPGREGGRDRERGGRRDRDRPSGNAADAPTGSGPDAPSGEAPAAQGAGGDQPQIGVPSTNDDPKGGEGASGKTATEASEASGAAAESTTESTTEAGKSGN